MQDIQVLLQLQGVLCIRVKQAEENSDRPF
jgi:hypothetical protein